VKLEPVRPGGDRGILVISLMFFESRRGHDASLNVRLWERDSPTEGRPLDKRGSLFAPAG